MAGMRRDFQIKEAIRSQLQDVENGKSRTLALQQCGLQETDIQFIGGQHIQIITTVKLDRNSLSWQSVNHLSEGKWTHLTFLSLGGNNIGNKGCKFLTKGPWKQLTTLYLVNNEIQAIGTNHLSKAQWRRLDSLNLNCNRIQDGVDFIMKGYWTGLGRLFIRANGMVFILLKRTLKSEWPSLSALSLTHNMDSNDDENELATLLCRKYHKITQLIIWY